MKILVNSLVSSTVKSKYTVQYAVKQCMFGVDASFKTQYIDLIIHA